MFIAHKYFKFQKESLSLCVYMTAVSWILVLYLIKVPLSPLAVYFLSTSLLLLCGQFDLSVCDCWILQMDFAFLNSSSDFAGKNSLCPGSLENSVSVYVGQQ